jgi:hypothetical protein
MKGGEMNFFRNIVVFSFGVLMLGHFVLLGVSAAADPCQEQGKNMNSVNQQYRAAIRDVSSSCTRVDGDCQGAKSSADNVLTQLMDAHGLLMSVCVGTNPPPPPAQPPSVQGDIVITEFMANPITVTGQWFEIYNPRSTDFDLYNITIKSRTYSITISTHLIIPAGTFLVLGINGDQATNGGIKVDYVYSGLILGVSSGDIEILNGTISIDKITYTAASYGKSRSLSSGCLFDAICNDNEIKWCDGNTPISSSGGLGTPGAANDCTF